MSRGTLRLFVAAYPPLELAASWLEAARTLPDLPKFKLTRPDQVHLTLQFIGDTSQRELPDVEESVRASCRGIGPIDLMARRLISLPERGPARVLAMETDAPSALTELHGRLAHRLARNLRERPGDRFLPHFTLGRFPGGGVAGARVAAEAPGSAFAIGRVRLMRSVLRPEGAEHVEAMGADLVG